METRADIQHQLTQIKDICALIMWQLENLFDNVYKLNRLPLGSIAETEEKLTGRKIQNYQTDSGIVEEVIDGKCVTRETRPLPQAVPVVAPVKKPRQKKKQIVVASPTGPVTDEILNM